MTTPSSDPWRSVLEGAADWRPSVPGVDAKIQQAYASGAARVALYIGYFAEERQGAEAVNELTDWAGPSGWRKLAITEAVLPVDGAPLETPCLRLGRDAERRLVCYWYWVDGEMTASPYLAKLLRVRAQIFGGLRAGSIIAVSSPYGDSPEAALEILRAFLGRVEPLDRLLFRAAS